MQTDYIQLGRSALERLRRTTTDASLVQNALLRSLMQENCSTVFGQRHGFAAVRSMRDYQDAVPLSTYADYAPYIQALMNGADNQLTRQPPVYFSLTSGSTDTPKYVPVTEADMDVHYHYIYGGIYGMLREYYPDLAADDLFGKIFQVGEFAKTHLPSGAMNGIRSGSLYQWLDRDGEFDASDYCVPKEVLFPARLEDLTYVKVRFALAERELRGIHSVFGHRVVSVLEYIRRNWALLLRDMAHGTVDDSIPLGADWREKLRRWLPPDPARVAELRAIDPGRDPYNMVGRIWPHLKYIIAINGQNFPHYDALLQTYAPGVPVHPFIYGASEGFLSIGRGVNCPDAYVLLPEAGLFEFLPVGTEAFRRPLTIGEITSGQRYELIFTNRSGLYRYRMQDILEVTDFYGQSPVVRFCYRRNQLLHIADENVDTQTLEQAVQQFAKGAGVCPDGFCVQADYSTVPGRYLFYLECPPVPSAAEQVDACLRRASLSYHDCRCMGDIDLPAVRFLPAGTFLAYEQRIAADGRAMAQYKPVRVLDTEEKQKFFAQAANRETTA